MNLKNILKLHNLLPVTLFIFSMMLVVALFAFGYLGVFSRYGADDYCFTSTIYQSDNIIQATVTWYLETSNRYTTMLLIGASEWFGRSAISFLPMLAILLWLVSLSWTFSQISRKLKFTHPLLSSFTLAAVIIFFSILEAPNRYQSLYWRSGMVTYFFPLIAFSYLTGLILTEAWRNKPRTSAGWIAILAWVWFGFFFAGGLSETTLAIQGGSLGLAIIAIWLLTSGDQRKKILSMLIIALVASVIALVVVFVAPANSLRINPTEARLPLIDFFRHSFIFALNFIQKTINSMPTPTLIILISGLAIGFGLWTGDMPFLNKKTFVTAMIATPLLTYILIFFSMMPAMYGQQSFPAARSLMAACSILVTGLLGFGLLAGLALRMFINSLFTNQKSTFSIMILSALFIFLCSIYPLYAARKILTQLLPRYVSHVEQWDARDTQIRQSVAQGATDLVVIQIDDMDGVLEYKAHNWVGRCAADYYGLDTLSAP